MDGMKTSRDSLEHVQKLLPKAHDYTDKALTCLNAQDPEEALGMLAASQCQNTALDNLCAAVKKLLKSTYLIGSQIPVPRLL
jgi:hypothetical protein